MAGTSNSATPNKTAVNVLPAGVTVAGAGQSDAGAPASTNVPGAFTQNIKQTAAPTPAPVTVTSTNQLTGPAATQAPGVTNAQQNAINFAINGYNQQDGMGRMPGSTGSGSGTDTLPGGLLNNPALNELGANGDVITNKAPNPAPAPSPTPGITQQQKTSAPSATTPATATDITNDFTTDFGRPVAPAGEAFYESALQQNPGMTQAQLDAMIKGGAQTQDQAAATSLQGKGLLQSNWTQPTLNPSDVAGSKDTWNPTTNQWQTAASGTGAPAPATSVGYTAAQDTVTPGQTVAGNLANNLNVNSPLIQLAQTQGNEQSNARGLLNSSIGVSAAENAMIQAALPVSEQDASTQAQAALANQAATNNASAFTSGAANQAALANLSSTTQTFLQGMQDATTAATSQLSASTQLALGQLSSTTQQAVQGMVNTNQQLLQTSTSSANAFNTAMNNIASIQQSATMDGAAKQTAVDQIVTQLQNFLNAQSQTAKAGGVTNLPNLAQYFPNLESTATSGNGLTTPPTGNGTTPPTGAAEGSTYTSNGLTYVVTNGTGILASKLP